MPATATARSAPARPAPRRGAPPSARAVRTAPARRARPAPAPRLVPVAVGRTAVAVGGIADSRFVLHLTRSRLWIGLLATLLVGIVGLNVAALSFNAASSKSAGLSDELRSENSALAAQIADGLSNERLQGAAARMGLVVPEPGSILYLEPKPGDAAAAAKRLERGAITAGTAYVPPATTVVGDPAAEAVAPADPAATTLTEEPAPVAEAAPATETTSPAPTTEAPPAGGVTMP